LEKCAIPAVTAHLTTSLAFAVYITITVFPQPVAAQAVALGHSPVVVFRQKWCEILTECRHGCWCDEHANWI